MRFGRTHDHGGPHDGDFDSIGYPDRDRGRYDDDDVRHSDAYEGGDEDGALVPVDEDATALALPDDSGPLFVPGSGRPMGKPFIKRRARPLTMRLAIITLTACLLVTGLFAVTPLGSSADGNLTTFQQIAGSVVLNTNVAFRWVIAQAGDTPEGWAKQYNCQVGGIYELNGLLFGQELQLGKAYKIPEDPKYGANYHPASLASTATGNGATVLGKSIWTSFAGTPPNGALCDPGGIPGPENEMSYHLLPPNKGAWWVRGFTWLHDGVDLAAPEGNPIHPVQVGEVIWAGWDFGGFGNAVKINHCNGLSTIYGHMEKLNVSAGQNVTPDDIIGWEGSTGYSTGPHLHLSVDVNNHAVDPMPYFGNSEFAITDNPSYQ